ncbi:MAG: ATPase [Desulfuromonadales bacterium]|nr:ATPase [Desulfuromonadales bacterium]
MNSTILNQETPRAKTVAQTQKVTKDQLREATRRQRLHGGRLGENLLELGYITEDQLGSFFHRTPPAPETVEQTGLSLDFIADLALKHVMNTGEFLLSDLSRKMGLPSIVLDDAITLLRDRKLLEVRSATQFVKSSFKFVATATGKKVGGELMEICRYTGPAPVTLDAYREMVANQSIRNIMVDDEVVRAAFSGIVISEDMIKRLGPAISSGAPMFIYGPPGNGKTTIAETIGQVLPETIYVPHALYVGGQIIALYDPVNHVAIEELPDSETEGDPIDRRWVQIQRPVIITGGELTLRMLDLEFNTIAKFYEAPLQMKANNGLFILDDFGRQKMDPQSLLNRWIINLDRQIDFLSLHTGMKFEIPFDQLVIFATNLEPKTLVDEAFLRRIRYKVKIEHPSADQFRQIFERVCQTHAIAFRQEVYDHLIEQWYKQRNRAFNACHPRDLIEHILDTARYNGDTPELRREAMDRACENYFVEI